jgi:ABC-type transport system substrate-binding protein
MIYGIPATLAALTIWSARQDAAGRAGSAEEIVVASNESALPSLNPLMPSSEADREIARLTHQPVLRIGPHGRIAPALVDLWGWTQISRAWFANEDYARQAASKLSALSEADRSQLGIASIQTLGAELRVTLAHPGSKVENKILPVIASCGPFPVEFIRVEMSQDARVHHEFFMKNAVESGQVKSVWFDGARAYELAVSGETVKFAEELNLYYQNHPALQASIHRMGKAAMLHEPVLDLILRKNTTFSSGAEIKAEDVRATISLVMDEPWPVRGRDALRLALQWEAIDPHTLRATFKPNSGSAIMAFTDLPVLPAEWITKHREELKAGDNSVFLRDPPPTTGEAKIEDISPHAIALKTPAHRARFMLNLAPETVRMGFAMGEVDAFWPSWRTAEDMTRDGAITLQTATLRNRLLVLWNCRKPPLDNVHVREALGLAVDRQGMIRDLLHGQAQVKQGIFQPGLWFAQDFPVQPRDLVKAARLLQEAGWKRENEQQPWKKNGAPFQIELLTLAGNPERAAIADHLRNAWRALGIAATVTEVTADELVNLRLPEHRFDATLIGLDFETSWDQTAFWRSTEAQGGLNFAGVADRDLDEMLDALRAEFDPEKVPDEAHAVENRLVSLHPFLPLFAGSTPFAIRSSLLPHGGSTPQVNLESLLFTEAKAK